MQTAITRLFDMNSQISLSQPKTFREIYVCDMLVMHLFAKLLYTMIVVSFPQQSEHESDRNK